MAGAAAGSAISGGFFAGRAEAATGATTPKGCAKEMLGSVRNTREDRKLLASNWHKTAKDSVDALGAGEDYIGTRADTILAGKSLKAIDEFTDTIPSGQKVDVDAFSDPTSKEFLGIGPASDSYLVPKGTEINRVTIVGTGH